MPDLVKLLEQLGFSAYEAQAYIALVQYGTLNGYELAKRSGVPRANIYGVLAKLEERGAAVRIHSVDRLQYAPVPPDQLLDRLKTGFATTLTAARDALAAIERPVDSDYVWNASGSEAFLQQARALLSKARTDLLIACGPDAARALVTDLRAAAQRGVAIKTLCLTACGQECGACQGEIFRYRFAPDHQSMIILADNQELLIGDLYGTSEESVLTVGTRQQLLVTLAGWAIRHSVALALLLKDPEALNPEHSPRNLSALTDMLPTFLAASVVARQDASGTADRHGNQETQEE